MNDEKLNIINICKELQQENETLNDRWKELVRWLCKKMLDNQGGLYVDVIIKMQELEREM